MPALNSEREFIASGSPVATTTGRLHLSPSPPLPLSPSSDNGRHQYHVTIMRPGRVLQDDGEISNWLIPAEVIQAAAPLFEGVASYLDHPELFGFGWRGEPQVRNLIGVIHDPVWDVLDQALVGTLRLYDQDPASPGHLVAALLDQMLTDQQAGLDVPPIGLSAVFFHRSHLDDDTGLRITTEFRKIESVDIVYSPGAGGYVRHALSALRASPQSGLGASPTFVSTENTSPERSAEMPPENESPAPAGTPPAPPEMTQDQALAALQAVSAQLAALTARIEAQEADRQAMAMQVAGLNALAVQREESHTIHGLGIPPRSSPVTLGPAGLDQLQAAWDWIFGVPGSSPPPPDIRRTDRLYYLLTGDGEWRGVFNGRDALAAATSSTLADMAVNAMNKVIVPLYDRLVNYRWFEPLVTVQATDGSLHDMAWIQFGGIADLPVVAEGAAYTELTVADSKESDAFVKYGGYVGITDKLLRNSDVAKLQAIPRALTIAAVQTRSAKIASIFTQASGTGPTLDQDNVVLFHTNSHGNLAATAFSFAAWAAARLECYKQTEMGSSKRQGLWPKFWLGPADLYDAALDIFGYGAGIGGQPGTANNDVNPYALARPGDPRPIPIAVPEFTDVNDWAYLADPLIAPIIQMAYADNPGGGGHPAPQLYMVTSPLAGLMFTNDVLPIKVRDYFAYGVATYRGIGKRNV
jgi:hypothetical protein